MNSRETPYKCHLFICTKTRDGIRPSCGDHTNPELKAMLKHEVKKHGWKGMVRISDSGCLGLCSDGPNILIYPQKIWLSNVALDDVPEIIRLLEEAMGS